MENRCSRFLQQTKGKLIVSCQALEEEPLYSSYIMSRMALAAMRGGASAIRANSAADIKAIREQVALPVIGIIKHVYESSPVYITPTETEVDALVTCGADVIATDATNRPRPRNVSLKEFFTSVRKRYPNQLFMADCSTIEEALFAQEIGFDMVGSTMCGYTEYTRGTPLPSFSLLRRMGECLDVPIIAEGGIWTPEDLVSVLKIPGVHAAVIGSAITRPMDITRRFVSSIGNGSGKEEAL